MRYLGGKSRLAKSISETILSNTDRRARFIEPMVGGGNILPIMAKHFDECVASDIHEDLILMWKSVSEAWIPPENISEEEYQAQRDAEPSALRGFVGFGATFGGKWFGGYARDRTGRRNLVKEAQKSTLKKAEQFKEGKVTFLNSSYDEIEVSCGDVVYLDPPYTGTTTYKGTPSFDHEKFWRVLDTWVAKGAHVFVSEFSAPDDWTVVWEKERLARLGGHDEGKHRKETDKLFYKKP